MNSDLQRPFRLGYSVEYSHTYPIRPKSPLSRVMEMIDFCQKYLDNLAKNIWTIWSKFTKKRLEMQQIDFWSFFAFHMNPLTR